MTAVPHRLDTLDTFLADGLPPWLRRAAPQDIAELRSAFVRHRKSEALLTTAMASLIPPATFAKTELEAAITLETGSHIDLTRALWRERWQDASLLGGEAFIVRTRVEPALSHLMQNFPAGAHFDAHTGLVSRQPQGHLVDAPMLIDTARLARLCHRLDLGQRYQQHLSRLLSASTLRIWAEEQRRRLVLSVHLATLRGHLSAAAAAHLSHSLGLTSASTSQAEPVQRLVLLGCAINGGLLVPWQPPGEKTTAGQGVILYLSHGPVQAFGDWSALNDFLRDQLRAPRGRATLLNRMAFEERGRFLGVLGKRLADPHPDLEVTGHRLSGDPFDNLARLYAEQQRANAAYLLVPSHQADERAKRARLATLEAVGSDLLQLASFFVPGLNELMLAEAVVSTLHEAFEGVRDWQRGHQHEAVEHWLGVAEAVAVNTLTLAGGKALGQWYRRSAHVESLVPVAGRTGHRLWHADLTPYRCTTKPANAVLGHDGLYRHEQRRWWRRDQAYHEVGRREGQWHLLRQDGKPGFGPALQGNGDGGWWLAWQRPQSWENPHGLLMALWPAAGDLSAAKALQAMRIAEVDLNGLRRLLTYQQPLPVALRDTLERALIDQRIDRFFTDLTAAAPADGELLTLCQALLHTPAAQAIDASALLPHQSWLRPALMQHLDGAAGSRDATLTRLLDGFPGLPERYARTVLTQASNLDRARLDAQRLPLAVAQQARAALAQARRVRALQGLYFANGYTEHLPKLVFALLAREGAWPADVPLELRDTGPLGAVRARLKQPLGTMPRATLVTRKGRLTVYAQGQQLFTQEPPPVDLFALLLHFVPAEERVRRGWEGIQGAHVLRQQLQASLPTAPEAIAALVGAQERAPAFVAPQRLADRRFGYLLNGRDQALAPAERTLQDRARSLYPGFNERQLALYIQVLHEQPGSAFSALLRDEANYRQLDQALANWAEEASASTQRTQRQRLADALRRCWRLQGVAGRPQANGDPGMALTLSDISCHQLPNLPAQSVFLHVTELTLEGMQLQDVPSDFLRPFRHVRMLNLDHNRLTSLPSALGELEHVQELMLTHNRLAFSDHDSQVLGRLGQLRTLVLNHNPLQHFDALLQALPRLRQLGLRDTGLTQFPEQLLQGLSLEMLDLRDNRITQLPPQLRTERESLRRGLALQGNPLPWDYPRRWLGLESSTSESEASLESEAAQVSDWLDGADPEQRVMRTTRWNCLADEPNSRDLFDLLADLTQTSDYRLARLHLQERVWSLLDALERETALREEIFTLASQPRSCIDSVLSVFAMVEVRALSFTALRGAIDGGEAGLLRLARRLFRLDQVEAYARHDMAQRERAGRGVDEVEVSLAYRVGLATPLELPGQPQSFQFERVANVSQADLEAAEVAVRAMETPEALVSYISERDYWLQHLRVTYGPQFEAVESPFWDRLDTLDAQRAHMTEQAYLEAFKQLALAREAAMAQEAQRLTREAIARCPNW